MTVPIGVRIELDADTRRLADDWLWGGSPARALRLSAGGRRALAELSDGTVTSRAGAVLARRLVDGGLAHLAPEPVRGPLDVTVVIPVRDRAGMLGRCLAALGARHPVLVVDDGSDHPAAVAAVAAEFGARLLTRTVNGGPGAARNDALAEVSSELVAFLDSDCVPPADWIDRLAAQFADPAVVAVAPRIVAEAATSASGRYAQAAGSLDLGVRAARVRPGTRVGYVPTAALLVKRAALASIAREGRVFDESLRYGEDVDLIWRLHAAGGQIRYEPTVQVRHHEPDSWSAYLARRYRYGTSAAPLAQRHPGALSPLVLYPWPALTAAGVLSGRPTAAVAGALGGFLNLRRKFRRAGMPSPGAATTMLTSTGQTLTGLARYGVQFASPALLMAGVGGSPRRRWLRLAAGGLAIASPALRSWQKNRPQLNPAAFVLAAVADDIAYGAGVWSGALALRDLSAVLPDLRIRPAAEPPGAPRSPNRPLTQGIDNADCLV